MDKFWKWVVTSSADPTSVSATVKGLIVGIIPMAVFAAGFLHLHVLPEQIQGIAELVRQIVEVGLGIVSAGIFLFGLIRKIANAIRDLWLSWKTK